MRVRIRQAALNEIVSHAREELPNECCGLLVGTADEVTWAERARNLKAGPTRFLIDPEAHFAAIRRARAAGLVVMGAYHSHPRTPAWPSDTDRAEDTYPEFLKVIVSLAGQAGEPDVRAFRVEDGNIQSVELVLLG